MTTYRGYEYIVFFHYRIGSFCAYVKVPKGHPAYKKHYDEIDVHVHGGLTFGSYIPKKNDSPQGFTKGYWIGWDYAHVGDFTCMYYFDAGRFKGDNPFEKDKHWQSIEVEEHCIQVIDQLIKMEKSTENEELTYDTDEI